MDFNLTDRQHELRRRAASLATEIMVFEDECEMDNGLSPESHAAIKAAVLDAGLHAINMPVEWGGSGPDPARAGRRPGAARAADERAVGHRLAAGQRAEACTPEQRERWLLSRHPRRPARRVAITEALAGIATRRPATTAPRRDGWVTLTARSGSSPSATCADYLIVLAARRRGRAPTMFLVDKDTPGCRRHAPRATCTPSSTSTLSSSSTASGSVRRPVPRRDRRGLRADPRLVRRGAADDRRPHHRRRRARPASWPRDWATTRVQGGQPIANHQLIQGMLADCAVDIAANRALVHQVAWEAHAGDSAARRCTPRRRS